MIKKKHNITSAKEVELSIIIPCFNDFKYIKKAIDSANAQDNVSKEIIVVDDGSNARTKELLKSLNSQYDLILKQENNGQSSARNRGVKAARGEYILVHDSDDFFEPEFSRKAIDLLKKNSDIKLVTCYFNRIMNKKKLDVFKPSGGVLKNFLRYNQAPGSVMFRKGDWYMSGGYDEEMRNGFEDWEFYIRLLKNGGRVEVLPEVLFNYRVRKNGTTSRANLVKYDLLKFIYTKHKDLFIEHYEDFISHLLSRIHREEGEKLKLESKLEFKIGQIILVPLRLVKRIFKIISVK